MKVKEKKLTNTEKMMCLLSHISIIIPNIGIIVPILIWTTNKGKSKSVRFHSLQSIFYQMVFIAAMMLSMAVGIVLMLISMMGMIGNPDAEPNILFYVSMLFMFLYFPLWVFFSIYSIFGAVLSYKGKDFKYLFIGKIIERKISKK